MALTKLTSIKGDTIVFSTNLKDASGEPIAQSDISTILCTLKKTINGNIIFQKTLDDMTYEEGLLTITFAPSDTEPLSYGDYYFDIEVTLNSGYRKSKLAQLTLTEEVTTHEV